MIHFWPSDKRKIYRANKVNKNEELSLEQIADVVNSGPKLITDTTPNEIMHLKLAASPLPIDAPVGLESNNSFADIVESREELRPDILFEDLEEKNNLNKAYNALTVFEKKLLKMKGLGL